MILDFYFGIIKVKETKAICLNFYEILWGFSLMKNTNLVYGVKDNPGFLKTIVFALQKDNKVECLTAKDFTYREENGILYKCLLS